MATHTLKTWPDAFAALWRGEKTAEFRRDDRGYEIGDRLILREYDPEAGAYLGRVVDAVVSHVASDPRFGIPEGYAMLSLRLRWRGNPGGETPYNHELGDH